MKEKNYCPDNDVILILGICIRSKKILLGSTNDQPKHYPEPFKSSNSNINLFIPFLQSKKKNIPLRTFMEIKSCNHPCTQLVTDIIESSKTSTINSSNTMIRYKKMFFPSHKDEIFIMKVINKSVIFHMTFKGAKSRETSLYNCFNESKSPYLQE